MDPMSVVEQIGGGLQAVVIVGQAIANIVQYRRNNQLQDKLLDLTQTMGKENRDLLSQTNLAISANAETMREAVRELRGRK